MVLRSDGLLGELKKALVERMLNAEMNVRLAAKAEQEAGNHRNGSSQKTMCSEDAELVLSIPRDRHRRFDPALIRKYQCQFPGFDQKIIGPIRPWHEHTGHPGVRWRALRCASISPNLVPVVTDSVIDEVRS